jgi:chemosensory pili system protein ChpA (sensor histidine kinase/response regulator)
MGEMIVQTDKNLSNLSPGVAADLEESDQEKSLRWLLDMDLSEPQETLFTVAGNDYFDTGLSAFEAEVAGRPLVRGNTRSDDLATYIEEEIVISSTGSGSDIYHRKEQLSVVDSSRGARDDEVMALDFSRSREDEETNFTGYMEDGADILGLSGDDDIGEKFVSIKRIKPVVEHGAATGTANGSTRITMQSDSPAPNLFAGDDHSGSVNNETPVGMDLIVTPVLPVESTSPRSSVERAEAKLAALAHPAAGNEFNGSSAAPAVNAGDDAVDDLGDYLGDSDGISLIDNPQYPSVHEYVATIPASMDDAEFDSYLLAGEHLPDLGSDPEELVVARDEGALSVDPSSVVQIDYHEDFGLTDSFELAAPVPAAAVNPPTVEQPVTDWALDTGFGEDIFGDDFTGDFSSLAADDGLAAQDIEAVFAAVSQFEESRDEICGVGFDAFEAAAQDQISLESLQYGYTREQVAQSAPPAMPAEGPQQDEMAVAPDSVEPTDLAAFDGTCVEGFVPDYITFNYSSQSNAEIFTDFLDAFIEEGSAEVEKLESEVGEWEKNIASEPLFAKVSRTLHTIKGIAKGVGLQRLGTLVHNFETLLEKMPRPIAGESQTYFRIVNAWLDAIVRGVEYVTEKRADVASEFPVPLGETAPEQREATPATSAVAPEPEVLQVEREDSKATVVSALERKRDQQLADEGAKVLAAQQSVRITSEKLDHLLNLTSQAQQLGVRASQNTTRSKRSSAELQARLSSVRTHIRKIADRALLDVNARPGSARPDLDALEMDQYSELQEAASILREGVEDLADLVDVVSRQNMQIEKLLKQQSSVISSISSSIQGARVVPVSRLMPGLRRIVRTVSTDLGKIVAFKVLNETGALDRDHYARLQVIMEHMVRNALDHGIESPDERVAMGKPTGGRITIDVRKSGSDYLICLADDGRGIDPDAIRESAYEKGLDVDVDALSDEEAIRLIFHKGFSTASTLSEISGRGVGMDIVLTELQQIGGDVQIQSTVGVGTAFEVRIPSNVSVNGALLVRSAGESYAIPLNGLIAVDQIPVQDFFAAVEETGLLPIAGMQCEPTYLATLCQGVGLPDRSAWGKFVPVIVAGTAERHMAIAIDSLEEALELVVRSLGSQFSTVPGVAGAATTAEGEAIIALDLNLLVSSAGADGIAPVAVSQPKSTTLLALVVDDSRTQRMVATSQLDSVGAETITAENGLVAIDLLNATHRLPDVILLDVEMPVKDGIQTLREIRKSRRYGHLPVIMVTSRTGAKHRALASEAGCNAYMGKPFNFPELIRQINELTGHDLQLT